MAAIDLTLDFKTKALICFMLVAGAGYVGFAMAMPAVQMSNEKQEAVDAKKQEHDDLQSKLRAFSKLTREKKELEGKIDALRGAVPKSPDLEILNLDLEKMCLDSGLEILAFKEASKEQKDKAGLAEAESPDAAGTNFSKGKQALANRVKGAMAPLTGAGAPGKPGAPGAKDQPAADPDAGLAKITMQVRVYGDYLGVLALMKKLETYQRVVAIQQIESFAPLIPTDAGKKGKLGLPEDAIPPENAPIGDWKHLNTSFLLTAYYLP
jgi:hypothetical protein